MINFEQLISDAAARFGYTMEMYEKYYDDDLPGAVGAGPMNAVIYTGKLDHGWDAIKHRAWLQLPEANFILNDERAVEILSIQDKNEFEAALRAEGAIYMALGGELNDPK